MDTFEDDFFTNVGMRHIEFDILDDVWRELQEEFAENGWTEQEGLMFLLKAGLRAVKDEQMIKGIKHSESGTLKELRRAQMEHLLLEGRYAVMKYRTFQLLQTVKALEWKLNAIRTENEGLIRANQAMRIQLSADQNR
ncbi:MAG: hypothetical protein WHV66_06325 [Anaerolineales bacterium]|jgi:hypothetical protein